MKDSEGTSQHRAGAAGTFFIRRLLPTVALAAACFSAAMAEPALTSLHAIHLLSNTQASKGLPVEFQATVTYFRGYEKTLYVQDGDASIDVQPTVDVLLTPGDRVLIKGTTHESFRPYVVTDNITVLHHGPPPPAVLATFDQLIRAELDSRLVTVSGVIRDADSVMSSDVRSSFLQMHTDGGDVDVVVDVDNPAALDGLLDADVSVTGVASGRFDGKMQQTGVLLHVTNLDGVKVLKHAATNPWTLPVTPMDGILSGYHVMNLSHRVRVHGTLTYYQPGSAAVMQDGTKSLWLMTSSIAQLHVGDIVDATGFPDCAGWIPLPDRR